MGWESWDGKGCAGGGMGGHWVTAGGGKEEAWMAPAGWMGGGGESTRQR